MSLILHPDPLLKKVSAPIFSSIPDDKELQNLVSNMYKVMETFGGVGLSAIQLGIPRSVFVLKIGGEKQTVINPSFKKTSDTFSYENEGCLSVPAVYTRIRRPEKIEVEFFDEKGERQTKTYEGIWARAFQHEYDHLCGVTFFDRMTVLQAKTVMKKFKKFTNIIPAKYFTGITPEEAENL